MPTPTPLYSRCPPRLKAAPGVGGWGWGAEGEGRRERSPPPPAPHRPNGSGRDEFIIPRKAPRCAGRAVRPCALTGLSPGASVEWGGGGIPGECCDLHRFFFFFIISPFFFLFPFPVLCFAFRFRSESEASSPCLQGSPPTAFPLPSRGASGDGPRTAAQFALPAAAPGRAAPRGLR